MAATNFDAQRKFAAGLPGATEDIKHGRFLELTGVPGVMPAPYLARAKWVQVKPGHALGSTALSELIRRSHALVLAKLPKKTQAEVLEGLS